MTLPPSLHRHLPLPRRWQSLSLLQRCLGLSLGLHLLLLAWRVAAPQAFEHAFAETPLEVILVNAAGNVAPQQAQALAQANLAGGGEAQDQVRATSPLPTSPDKVDGDTLDPSDQVIAQMQREQQAMLAGLKHDLAAYPTPTPKPSQQETPGQQEQARVRQQVDTLAEIDRRIRAENSRPKKRYLSPSTLRSADALYYNAFRTAVEHAGTLHYPSSGGRKLYGELAMEVTIDKGGRVLQAEVVKGSGNALLDKRARAIVMQIGHFGSVPDEVSMGRQRLLITSVFRFTRNEGLRATTQAPAPDRAAQDEP